MVTETGLQRQYEKRKSLEIFFHISGLLTTLLLQFGSHGNLEHGFARNRFWTIDDNPPPSPLNSATKDFVILF
jgi:hypothetical protein